MSGNKSNDAFDLLNSEFANADLEKENARNLENLRRKQAIKQQAKAEEEPITGEEEEDEGGSSCFGIAFRILIILLLAGALAWIVFMPAGSLNELMEKVSPRIETSFSWFAGLFGGQSGNSGPDNSSDVPASSDPGVTSSETVDSENVSSETATSETATSETTLPASSDEGTNPTKTDSSDVQDTQESNSPYSITVYRPSQIVIVYDYSGNPAKIFSCSSGKASTPTKLGDYSIRAKYRWRFMVGNCYTQYASSFSSGYLFHSIPYNRKNAGTMANSSYDKLGNPASSGCIRLCFRDSKWIYDNCPIGTPVHVVDENAPAGSVPEIIPERIKDSAHNGWDPTDDSPDSPYNQ